jgi:hypothetical protein
MKAAAEPCIETGAAIPEGIARPVSIVATPPARQPAL